MIQGWISKTNVYASWSYNYALRLFALWHWLTFYPLISLCYKKYCNAIIIKKTLRINKEIIKGITKQQKKKVIINREGNNIIMKLTQRKNIFFSLSEKNIYFFWPRCVVRFTVSDFIKKRKPKRPESESLHTNYINLKLNPCTME